MHNPTAVLDNKHISGCKPCSLPSVSTFPKNTFSFPALGFPGTTFPPTLMFPPRLIQSTSPINSITHGNNFQGENPKQGDTSPKTEHKTA